jgi:checkpoint serine/threonine-protein kinase
MAEQLNANESNITVLPDNFLSVKENVMPLKQGRNAETMVKILGQRADPYADRIKRFEQELVEAEKLDDPLSVWIECIEFVQQGTLGVDIWHDLIPLLERCTKAFQKDARYLNDRRYVNVWILYAERCADALDIFKFMNTNAIGAKCAYFYVAWALMIEERGRASDAEKIYGAGVKRLAEPVEWMKKQHRHFQARQMSSIMENMANEPAAQPVAPVREQARVSATAATSVSGVRNQSSSSGRTLKSTKPSSSSAKSNAGVFILSDDQIDKTPVSSRKPSASKGRISSASRNDENSSHTSWTSLSTQAERTKENVQAPSRWTDVVLETKAPAPQVAPISIFVDPECDEDANVVHVRSVRQIDGILTQSKSTSTTQ